MASNKEVSFQMPDVEIEVLDSDVDEEEVVLRHPTRVRLAASTEEIGNIFTSKKQTEIGSVDAISKQEILRAATLVEDAMEGRTVDIKIEPRCVSSYICYKRRSLTCILYLAILVDLALVLFEKPAVRDMELPYWATMIVEVICLIVFIARTWHQSKWRTRTNFMKDLKNISVITIICLTFVDIIAYIIVEHVDPENNRRYSRVLRPMVIMNFSDGRQIRRAWRNIRRTVKEILHVVVLFYFFIFVFALVALKVFKNSGIRYPSGKGYFNDYIESYWELYVLVTTANNPDVMMPAYDKSRFYCIFFIVYVVFCLYLMMNVLLAVTYHSYRENMKKEIKWSVSAKRNKLKQAFAAIMINRNGKEMVTYGTWVKLIHHAAPKMTQNQINLLMMILDAENTGHIGRREFMNVADLLNVPVSEVKDRMTFLESHFPAMYNSIISSKVRDFVCSSLFKVIFDALVVLDVIIIGLDFEDQGVFVSLFIVEILLKLYTFGPAKFKMSFMNWFDVVITSVALTSLFLTLFLEGSGIGEMMKAVVVCRIFRILRLLVHIERCRIIMITIVNISTSIVMYCGIVFVIFYMFAIIGMLAFEGRVKFYGGKNLTEQQLYCGNPLLKNSEFYNVGYCNNNFNDITNACLVLSTLLIENNWHIIAEGYTLVTNEAARIYFALFHLSMSIVVMNIVTAFVVDMFMYEYTMQMEGRTDSAVETKIKELGLGIDAYTGEDISTPFNIAGQQTSGGADTENGGGAKKEWRFAVRFSDFVMNSVTRKSTAAPTLNNFDGTRFHLKKKGWMKIEVLLQKLFEDENENDDLEAPASMDEVQSTFYQ